MTDLDKARKWAEDGKGLYSPGSRAKAVTDIILSLPDQWVDAENVRELVSTFHSKEDVPFTPFVAVMAFKECAEALESLLNQKLPTLADMTQEERAACRWRQCRAKGFSEDERLVIANVNDHWITLWREDGHVIRTNPGAVTPLPDLPKLEWPGNEVVETPALPEGMRLADHETLGRIVVSQRADEDGDYAFFESIPGGIAGAGWGYVNESELTFLDGGQHV